MTTSLDNLGEALGPADTWSWVVRKRLELWVNEKLGELVLGDESLEAIRAWHHDLYERFGWQYTPHLVSWLLQPGNEASWAANCRGYAERLDAARADLRAFDAAAAKHEGRPDRLRELYAGFTKALPDRRDLWLALTADRAHAFLRDRSRRSRMNLQWALTGGYHQHFGELNPNAPTIDYQAPEVTAWVDRLADSEDVRALMRGGEGNAEGGPLKAAFVFVSAAYGERGESTVRNAYRKHRPGQRPRE